MTKVSSTEVEGLVSSQLVIPGGAGAGMGIHYDIVGDTDVSSPTAGIQVKLNEKSLERAEKMTGATRTPKPESRAAPSAVSKKQEQSDNKYVGMFDKRGLSYGTRFGPRPDYRSTLSSSAASPLARVRQRRLLELRRTFDQIAAAKTKSIPISAERLPQETLKKMVEDAVKRGDQMTPIGSLSRAMKLAGVTPKELGAKPKPAQKKRQWALFFNPEMIPSGWATD